MSQLEIFDFKLYVAKGAPNSAKAIGNLRDLCQQYLASKHSIEVIDVLAQPGRANKDRILVTPTLIKCAPAPVVRILGNLSDLDVVLSALGILRREEE